MNLRTLSGADLKGKRVLVRVDFNVPIQKGVVKDKTRIEETLPTLNYLKGQGAKIILVSHLGRPDGKLVPDLKMNVLAQTLGELMVQEVKKLEDCIGLSVEKVTQQMKAGDILLLENVRFHAEEEKNDPLFAAALAKLADVYVNDAFGTAHRAHASTEGVAHLLPSYAGLLVEKELRILSSLMENSAHPLALVIGGAKIDTKIGLLEKFLPLADVFIIGGALANTFLAAQGHPLGASLYEADKIPVALRFLEKAQGKTVLLPVDALTALSLDAQPILRALPDITPEEKILDIGPKTLLRFHETLKTCKTVLWNGPMGLYEKEAFAEGTRRMAEILSQISATTVIGGGDTIDALHLFNIDTKKFSHISTGGGAMLEFLEGKPLPGLAVLNSIKA